MIRVKIDPIVKGDSTTFKFKCYSIITQYPKKTETESPLALSAYDTITLVIVNNEGTQILSEDCSITADVEDGIQNVCQYTATPAQLVTVGRDYRGELQLKSGATVVGTPVKFVFDIIDDIAA